MMPNMPKPDQDTLLHEWQLCIQVGPCQVAFFLSGETQSGNKGSSVCAAKSMLVAAACW